VTREEAEKLVASKRDDERWLSKQLFGREIGITQEPMASFTMSGRSWLEMLDERLKKS
jgi:hypothetical protein